MSETTKDSINDSTVEPKKDSTVESTVGSKTIFSKLGSTDIYNFNSVLNISATIFLMITMSTAGYAGYMWGSNSNVVAQWAITLFMGGIGFFESYMYFYSLSTLYYRRYTLFLFILGPTILLGIIGYFTTSFTLTNIISDSHNATNNAKYNISLLQGQIAKVETKIKGVSTNVTQSKESYLTEINTYLVDNKLSMTSSQTNKRFFMPRAYNKSSPIWLRYCMPGMKNTFTSDQNCANVQTKVTTKYNDIDNYYTRVKDTYDAQLLGLKTKMSSLRLVNNVTFENSAVDGFKGSLFSENESSSSMLIKLLSGGVIAVMLFLTSIKVFRDGKGYRFQPKTHQTNIPELFISLMMNKFKQYVEKQTQALIKAEHATLLLQHDNNRVQAHLTGMHVVTDDANLSAEYKDTTLEDTNENELISSILKSSTNIAEHKQEPEIITNRMQQMLHKKSKKSK